MKYNHLILLLIIFIISCNKEKSSPDPVQTADPIPQFSVTAKSFELTSKFLKREVSYSQPNPLLKKVRMFTYDNNKRCTEIKIGTIDSSLTNPVFNLTQTLTFKYGDPSTLLPSLFYSVKTVFPNLITTFYYNYNSQGRKTRDSVRLKNQAGQDADRVINYVYSEDRVYATPVLTGFPMENNSLDTLSLLSAGNIEKLVSRIIKSSGDQFVTYRFTYDNYISPYNKLNIANSLYFESAALGIGYNVPLETHYMGVTLNNMTSWTTGTYTVSFRYVYDADRYPVKKEMFLPGDISPNNVTYFEY